MIVELPDDTDGFDDDAPTDRPPPRDPADVRVHRARMRLYLSASDCRELQYEHWQWHGTIADQEDLDLVEQRDVDAIIALVWGVEVKDQGAPRVRKSRR